MRAALAAAARVAHLCPPGADAGEWPRQALAAVAAWARCPCAAHEAEAARLSKSAPRLSDDPVHAFTAALSMAAAPSRTAFAKQAALDAAQALLRERRVDDPHGEVEVAVKGALLGWALGGEDPLARLVAPGPEVFEAPAGPPTTLPRLLERTGQGAFWLDAQRDLVWDDGRRERGLGRVRLRPGTRARGFAASREGEVVAFAETSPEGEALILRRCVPRAGGRPLSQATRRVDVEGGEVVDVAVSPSAERLVWTVSPRQLASDGERQPDALWHLDLRRADARPTRVPLEHAVARALHFPTHCAVGFVTDLAAWDAAAPEERTTTLLGHVLVRMAMLP